MFTGPCFAKAITAMADKHSEDAHGAQREQAMGKATAQRKGDGGARVVALPADFRLTELAAVKAQLIDAFDAPAVQIDGAGVERVDTAALQLLVAFRRESAARGQSSAWQGVSAVMRDAASLLGLAQALELPAPMPA
jgi:phospholipid transport system transporter-binding protein